ncbi:MAG: crossover junction endodeoxyribonuclease RuvC [Gemmatimonadales bacterium]
MRPNGTLTVLGIDPGTTVLGYGVVTAGGAARGTARLVECGVVRTRNGASLPARLAVLFDGISELLDRHDPDAVAVEGLFHGRNARSALVLGHARGVVLLAAERSGRTIVEISPAEVKRAVTGTGGASKPQVGAMVMRLLRLTTPPRPADAADGVAIALTHLLRMAPRTRLAPPR